MLCANVASLACVLNVPCDNDVPSRRRLLDLHCEGLGLASPRKHEVHPFVVHETSRDVELEAASEYACCRDEVLDRLSKAR